MKTNSTISASSIRFKYFLSTLLLGLLLMFCGRAAAYEPVVLLEESRPAVVQEAGMLRGGVSLVDDLPQEFYGTWTVISVMENTNNPELFRVRSSDIWSLERNGDNITLLNPTNGAYATITVDEVSGQRAIFSRIKQEKDLTENEIVEITVQEDNFYGTDTIVMKQYKNGQRIKTDIVKYKVKGYKISGPTLKDIFAK